MVRRLRLVAVAAAAALIGAMALPEAAQAYGIDQCVGSGNLNPQTYYAVTCHGSFLDSDVYAAHVICTNGAHYSSGNYVTPTFGGWGETAVAWCPSGTSVTSAWHTTGD